MNKNTYTFSSLLLTGSLCYTMSAMAADNKTIFTVTDNSHTSAVSAGGHIAKINLSNYSSNNGTVNNGSTKCLTLDDNLRIAPESNTGKLVVSLIPAATNNSVTVGALNATFCAYNDAGAVTAPGLGNATCKNSDDSAAEQGSFAQVKFKGNLTACPSGTFTAADEQQNFTFYTDSGLTQADSDLSIDSNGYIKAANGRDASGTVYLKGKDFNTGEDFYQTISFTIDDNTPPANTRFIMLGANGTAVNSESQAQCVKDTQTGLIWELKKKVNGTPKEVPHDGDDTFHWNGPQETSTGSYSLACYGVNNHDKDTWCDTKDFVNRVNTQSAFKICGYTGGWRMPDRRELFTLLDQSKKAPPFNYNFNDSVNGGFPNDIPGNINGVSLIFSDFWTSKQANNPQKAYYWIFNILNGNNSPTPAEQLIWTGFYARKDQYKFARLVRGTCTPASACQFTFAD